MNFLKKLLNEENARTSIVYNKSYSNEEIDQLPWFKILAVRKRDLIGVILGAIFFNFAIVIFISRAQIIPQGITGASVTFVFLVPASEPYYGFLYFISHIFVLLPLWKKSKPTFRVLSLTFLIINIFFNSLLTISDVQDAIQNTITLAPGWSLDTIAPNNLVTWPILVYAVVGALLNGSSTAFLWKAGASTAGTDVISDYYSRKYRKSIGSTLRIISLASLTFYFIIYTLIRKDEVNSLGTPLSEFFSTQIIASIIYVIIFSVTVNVLYPRDKKMRLQITTTRPEVVEQYFSRIKYWRPYTITKTRSGYTGKNTFKIETIMLFFETKIITHDLKYYDPSTWMVLSQVDSIIGSFNTRSKF